ncbi:MAG TPA: hypothetical protein VFH58_06335, partial [Acidimicrobiales bacterium]|nr:hypothetical protein [Acidimicrobiales bacterium]
DHFNMVGGYPLPVPHPTSWLVIGPWELLAGIPALHAVRRLAARSGLRRGRLVLVQLWFAVVVLTPCAAWSHPEDVLAIAFLLYGLTALHDGRQERAALWVAAAVCSKQWALVAIPFLLVRTAPGSRRRVLLWCVVPPVLMAAFPLAVNWSDASQCLLFPPVPPAVRDGHYSLVVPLFTRLAGVHGSMLGRAMELSAAPVVAYVLRRRPEAAQLGGLGGVLLLRLFFEPVVFPYYVAPAATLIGLACIAASRRLPLELMWWQAVLTVWLLLASPRNGLWWTGAVVLVVAMGWGGWRSVAAARRPACLRRPPPRRWPTLYRFSNFVSKSSRILDFGTKL